tara:strand:- start:483 stop:944 length:462 start_codon:yes stop_codon:yes gene_type:complete
MKKLLLFTFSILFTLSSFAQDGPEIWMTYELKAKKGMEEKFEQAAAKKMKKFNNTAESAMYTFNIMDGENQGMYSRVIGWKDWDFMNSQDDRSDELKYWRDNVDPFIEESSGWKVWRRLGWVSHQGNQEILLNTCLFQEGLLSPEKIRTLLIF